MLVDLIYDRFHGLCFSFVLPGLSKSLNKEISFSQYILTRDPAVSPHLKSEVLKCSSLIVIDYLYVLLKLTAVNLI